MSLQLGYDERFTQRMLRWECLLCSDSQKYKSHREEAKEGKKQTKSKHTHKSAELIASLRFFTVKYFVLEFFFLFHFFFNFIFSFVFVSPMQWIVAILSVMNTFDGWHDYVAKISVWQFAFTGESLLSGSLFLIFIRSIKLIWVFFKCLWRYFIEIICTRVYLFCDILNLTPSSCAKKA